MKYLILTMRKPQFDPAVIPAHYAFLEELREGGVLEQAGPFTDESGGAYVIRADSFDEALAIAHRDPVHVRGCSEVTVREWNSK